MNEAVFDRELDFPGQYVKELRLIHSVSPTNKNEKVGISCLRFYNDDLSIFTNMFKSNGGSIDTRVNVEYKGSSLHYAMTIPITFFEEDLRKRLVHTVMIIHNGS